jgi:hypothetical protein
MHVGSESMRAAATWDDFDDLPTREVVVAVRILEPPIPIAPFELSPLQARARSRADETFIILPAERKSLGRWVITAAIVGLVLGLASLYAGVRYARHRPAPEPILISAPEPIAPPPALVAPAPPVAAVPFVSNMGTIVASPKQWITIDGTSAQTPIVVSCGKHNVQVGKRKGTVLDVPCGGEVAIPRR